MRYTLWTSFSSKQFGTVCSLINACLLLDLFSDKDGLLSKLNRMHRGKAGRECILLILVMFPGENSVNVSQFSPTLTKLFIQNPSLYKSYPRFLFFLCLWADQWCTSCWFSTFCRNLNVPWKWPLPLTSEAFWPVIAVWRETSLLLSPTGMALESSPFGDLKWGLQRLRKWSAIQLIVIPSCGLEQGGGEV